MRRVFQAADDVLPLQQIAVADVRMIFEMERLDDLVVEVLRREHQRQLVDRERHVAALDDGAHGNVAVKAHLLAHLERQRALRAADENVGLDADLAQLRGGLLRGLRLHLARGADVGNERAVHEADVVAPLVELELAQRLEERQPLDVARRPAELRDQHVHAFAAAHDALLDLVRDVRNHLHGLAEIVAAALLGDHGLVDLAGRDGIVARERSRREALVVTEVEVRLRAVVGDEDLAVLIRRHRARIHVKIRVEFLHAHLQPAQLQQRAERRRRKPFSQRRNYSACDKNVFHNLGNLRYAKCP